jgi:phage gp36-like protein
MAWATRSDLESRYSVSAIADLEAGGANVTDALADAEAEAAAYVGKAVSLPLSVIPDTVKRLVCQLARYNLWRRDLPEEHPVYLSYRDAVKELRDIADGKIVLPINAGEGETTADGVFCVKARSAVFTADAFAGMVL